MAQSLTKNLVGKLAYDISTIEDGVEIPVESVTEEDAIEYLHGYDNIVPGLEKALAGKKVGDSFDVTVSPADAYGEYDESLIEEIPRDEFDFEEEELELEIDMEVEMLDEDGDIVEGTIHEIRDDVVLVDLDPPLAGKTIRYAGKIIGIREATEDELEWGYPESLLDELFGDDEDDFDDE